MLPFERPLYFFDVWLDQLKDQLIVGRPGVQDTKASDGWGTSGTGAENAEKH